MAVVSTVCLLVCTLLLSPGSSGVLRSLLAINKNLLFNRRGLPDLQPAFTVHRAHAGTEASVPGRFLRRPHR